MRNKDKTTRRRGMQRLVGKFICPADRDKTKKPEPV
jgi:hypothetical protein